MLVSFTNLLAAVSKTHASLLIIVLLESSRFLIQGGDANFIFNTGPGVGPTVIEAAISWQVVVAFSHLFGFYQ